MGKNGAKFQRCTFNTTALKDVIIREMRHAAGREALSAKHDLLAVNLRDMFAIEELSYVVYSRLVALLELEYRRALGKIDRGKKTTGKGGLK